MCAFEDQRGGFEDQRGLVVDSGGGLRRQARSTTIPLAVPACPLTLSIFCSITLYPMLTPARLHPQVFVGYWLLVPTCAYHLPVKIELARAAVSLSLPV